MGNTLSLAQDKMSELTQSSITLTAIASLTIMQLKIPGPQQNRSVQHLLTSFTLFPELPLEIRRAIWAFAARRDCLFRLDRFRACNDLYPHSCPRTMPPEFPVTLAINQESRFETQMIFQFIGLDSMHWPQVSPVKQSSSSRRNAICFDAKHDIIFADLDSFLWQGRFAHWAWIEFKYDPTVFDNITELSLLLDGGHYQRGLLKADAMLHKASRAETRVINGERPHPNDLQYFPPFGAFEYLRKLKRIQLIGADRARDECNTPLGQQRWREALVAFFTGLKDADKTCARVVPVIIIRPYKKLDRTMWEDTQESIDKEPTTQLRRR